MGKNDDGSEEVPQEHIFVAWAAPIAVIGPESIKRARVIDGKQAKFYEHELQLSKEIVLLRDL